MLHSRTLTLATAAALVASLAACTTYDPNYPIMGVNDSHPNPGGVSVFEPAPATYVTPGMTTYVTPGYVASGTTTYVVPPGTTTTYVAPGTTVVAPAATSTVVQGQTYTYAVPAVEYGRVTNVALVSQGVPGTRASGAAGAIVGGVVGGALGSTIGGGAGRVAATILGAVTGAAVGNNLATRPYANYAGSVYRVWVQTDSGLMRTYDVAANANLHPGDRVRIENGAIYMG
jgi:outer membrane lipoprotein SlyB